MAYNIQPSPQLSEKFLELWNRFSSAKLHHPKSRYEYLRQINRICDYLECDFLDISLSGVNSYFKHLASSRTADGSSKYTLKTMNGILSYFKSISSFIMVQSDMEGYSNVFLSVDIEHYSDFINPASVPSLKELDMLLSSVKDNDMLYLIFSLIIRCSLTTSEICSLKAEMILSDGNNRYFISFRKKNNTIRRVKIPDDVVRLLLDYTSENNIQSGPLFFNSRGHAITYHNLNRWTKEAMTAAGFNYTLQDIRNSAIAFMLHGGADANSTAEYAGISERWMYRYGEVLDSLDTAPCDYQNFIIRH